MNLNKVGHGVINYMKPLRIFLIHSRKKCSLENYEPVESAYDIYEGEGTNSKPPILLLHALLASKNNWNKLAPIIQKRTKRKLISIDARNHGMSDYSPNHTYMHMASDIVHFVKKHGFSKVSLLGHSLGARAAILTALLRPDIVSSLVVEDISHVSTSPMVIRMKELFPAIISVTIAPGTEYSEAIKLASEQLKVHLSDIKVIKHLLEHLYQTESGSYAWRWNLPVLDREFLPNILHFPNVLEGEKYWGPTLFLRGTESDFIGPNDFPKLKESFPHMDMVEIQAPHWIHTRQQEQFLDVVCNFLEKHYCWD